MVIGYVITLSHILKSLAMQPSTLSLPQRGRQHCYFFQIRKNSKEGGNVLLKVGKGFDPKGVGRISYSL